MRHEKLLGYDGNNIIVRNKINNMENPAKRQYCLDFLGHQGLLTKGHRCRPGCFDFLRYQCVIEEIQQTLQM